MARNLDVVHIRFLSTGSKPLAVCQAGTVIYVVGEHADTGQVFQNGPQVEVRLMAAGEILDIGVGESICGGMQVDDVADHEPVMPGPCLQADRIVQREARPGSLPGRRDQLLFPCPPRMRAQQPPQPRPHAHQRLPVQEPHKILALGFGQQQRVQHQTLPLITHVVGAPA